MIEVEQQINAVRRRVGTRVLEAGEARTVTVSQEYDATVDDVWDACTNAERLPRWFLPVSGDLRLGGRYQFEGNAGGTVQECDPPHSLAATWEYGGEVSWIELRLAPTSDGGTRLQLDHIARADDERWNSYGPGAVGIGWDLGLLGLATHLASGEAVDPQASEAWSASEDGKRFMTLSGGLWGEAAVAAGDDPADAQAAADRTTAFYTGAEPAAS